MEYGRWVGVGVGCGGRVWVDMTVTITIELNHHGTHSFQAPFPLKHPCMEPASSKATKARTTGAGRGRALHGVGVGLCRSRLQRTARSADLTGLASVGRSTRSIDLTLFDGWMDKWRRVSVSVGIMRPVCVPQSACGCGTRADRGGRMHASVRSRRAVVSELKTPCDDDGGLPLNCMLTWHPPKSMHRSNHGRSTSVD